MTNLWAVMLFVCIVDLADAFPSHFPKSRVPINNWIKHYEPAVYHHQHRRMERAALDSEENDFLKLTISTSNRVFKLLLKPEQFLFADDVVFEGAAGKKIDFDVEKAYVGTLEDDERTKVRGIITRDGLFDGTITTQFEEFYVEPVSRYTATTGDVDIGAHTIVYKISDVVHPPTQLCAISDTRIKQKPTDLNTIARRRKRKKRQTGTNEKIPSHPAADTGRSAAKDIDDDDDIDDVADADRWPKFSNLFTDRGLKSWDEFEEAAQKSRFRDSYRILLDASVTPGKSGVSALLTSRSTNAQPDSVDFAGNADGTYYDLDFVNILPELSDSLGSRKLVQDESRNFDFNDDHLTKLGTFSSSVHESNSQHWRPKTDLIDTVYKYTNVTKNSKSYTPTAGIIHKSNPKILIANGAEESRSNLIITSDDSLEQHARKSTLVDPRKTTCMLYLQADHLFFEKYGTEETCIEVMTRHVQRVNSIYRNTDFNQDGKPDNISFMIKRIKVHSIKDPSYRFPGNYGVEKFLEIFSEEDYDAFCLAYMFTYRDFEMGTLGLAWTGDLKNAGGVCEKNGHYRGSLKSLNTGIVTVLNYGKHVPSAVSHVTLAHEIGHNFGSPHDPDGCTPGGNDGNFIMFARATSGDKKNNNKFSPCSLHAINPVLNVKARSSKGCFTEPQTSICGNGVVEPGEQCDCGWEEDCKDTCCYPQRRYPPVDEIPCNLRPYAFCSPSQGPCCTTDCKIKSGAMCRNDNGCRDASYCNGKSPQCPPSINKPNKTVCNEEYVCYMGECTGSICLAYGLESCQCIPTPSDPPTKACELCCKMPGENQPCLSSFQWNQGPYDVPDMFAKPGTPCNDYNGYCDVFRKCREVDPSGPIATLRKLLLSEENIASFKKWAYDHWYYCGMIFLIFVLLMIFSTKVLGKKPKVKTITVVHSSPTETVRLPTDGSCTPAVVVHPIVVRSKLPFKKKVHESKRRAKSKKEDIIPHNVNNNNSPVEAKRKEKRTDKINVTAKSGGAKTKVQKSKLKKEASVPVQSDGIALPTETDMAAHADDPLGKVRNWLINSHNIDGLTSLKKSKSSPANFDVGDLTGAKKRLQNTNAAAAPKISTCAAPSATKIVKIDPKKLKKPKDRVKLQVVYKPPFKFSVKLGKNKNEISSQLIKDKRPEAVKQRAALLVRADRIRTNAPPPPPPPLQTMTNVSSSASTACNSTDISKSPQGNEKSKSSSKTNIPETLTTVIASPDKNVESSHRAEYKRSVSAPQPDPVYENTLFKNSVTVPAGASEKNGCGDPCYANVSAQYATASSFKTSPLQCLRRRNSGDIRHSNIARPQALISKRRNSWDAIKSLYKLPASEMYVKRQYSDETDAKSANLKRASSIELHHSNSQVLLRVSNHRKSNASRSSKPVRLKVVETATPACLTPECATMSTKLSKRRNSNIITHEAKDKRSRIRRSMSSKAPQNDADKLKRHSLQCIADLTRHSKIDERIQDVLDSASGHDCVELPFRSNDLTSEIPSDLEVLLSETENAISTVA